jgi:hypothetical protein
MVKISSLSILHSPSQSHLVFDLLITVVTSTSVGSDTSKNVIGNNKIVPMSLGDSE